MTSLSLPPVLLDGLNRHLGSAVFTSKFRGKFTPTPVDTLALRVENAWERLVDVYHDHRAGAEKNFTPLSDVNGSGLEHVRYALSLTSPAHPQREAYPSERVVRAAFNVLINHYLEYQSAVNNAHRLRANVTAVRMTFAELERKNKSVVRFSDESPSEGCVVLEVEDADGNILRYSATPLRDRVLFGISVKGATICDDMETHKSGNLHQQSISNLPTYRHFMGIQQNRS